MSTITKGLVEVQEIILATGIYTMNVTAADRENVESLNHNLGLRPYFDYMISYDNKTYVSRNQYSQTPLNYEFLRYYYMYTDKNKVYFHYLYTPDPSLAGAFTVYFSYKLFILESAR